MSELLPIFPLGTVVFPGMPLPLHIFEERYRRMLADRVEHDPAFGIVLLRTGRDNGTEQTLFSVGTAARIVSRRTRRDGRSDIVIEGTRRFDIEDIRWDLGYGLATIQWRDEMIGNTDHLEATRDIAIEQFQRYVRGVTKITGRRFRGIRLGEDPTSASYDLASRLPLHTWERQDLLEAESVEARFESLLRIVRREVALLAKSGTAGLAINHPGQTFTLN
ncbi:MAG TPA: LON peptidase substrate-binding domain-containing protein [Thermomicrobiales bacterium]|nr:LON peptidase substrate-binding domain-containing protein [Thermomicrobiales bacterium]